MSVELNHTIVRATDKDSSAEFLTRLMGLPPHAHFGPFAVVEVSNGVSLDYMDTDEIVAQHYAFLVSDNEFDDIFGRIQRQGLSYWADPTHREPGEINTRDGGRGVYFDDPNGHNLEILTRPYGSGS